ncbi:MAG: hypothetical protein GY835_12655 [bacterium]|nr:hypothetical protein [bacterium]
MESSDFQLDTGQYLDVYAFQGKRNEAVSVTLVSEDFDSYLVILDQTGEILATDDDSGFGSDALVADLLLPADGRYYAWVYSVFAGETGDYLLELSNANENDGELPLKKVVDPEEGMTLMMKRKSRPLVQPRDILGLDFNWETIPDITRKKGDPFTDADRCKGSSAPYEAKVNVCVWTRPGYTGPGTGFPFNVTIYVEGFTDSTEMNEDDGITITPPAFVTKPIPAPGECVTFAKWVIITENASAGAKSIRAIATESGSGEPYGTEAEIGRDSEVMNVIGVRILPEYRFIKDGESTDFTKEVIPEGMVGVDSWGWDTPDGAGNSPSVRFFQLNNVTNALTKWYAFPDNACTASMMSTYQIKLSVKFGALVCAAEQVPLVVYLPEIPGETTVPILSGFPSCDDRGAGTLPWRVTGPGTLTRSAPKIVFNIHVASQFRNKVSSHEMVHVGQLTTGIGKNINTVAGFFPLIAGLTAKTEAALVTKIQNAFIQYSIIQDLLLLNLTPAMEKAAYGVSDPINPKYLYQNCGRF